MASVLIFNQIFIMKRIIPDIKVIPIIRHVKRHTIELSEKTLEKTQGVKKFLAEVANFFLFISCTIKETFSRDFELLLLI